MGFIVIGLIGYIIKLVFIPINNIILGAWWRKLERVVYNKYVKFLRVLDIKQGLSLYPSYLFLN